MIILISNDLMAAASIRRQAETLDAPLVLTTDIDAAVAKCNEAGVRLVLVDLATPGLGPQAIVTRLRSAPRPPGAIIAFGPHVQDQWLAAATEAGCDEVLSRGQFHAQATALLTRYAQK
jgi:CheY-like chemotaxis protein